MTTQTEIAIGGTRSHVHGVLHRHHQRTQLRVGVLGNGPLLVLLRVTQGTLICGGKVALGEDFFVGLDGQEVIFTFSFGDLFFRPQQIVVCQQVVVEEIVCGQFRLRRRILSQSNRTLNQVGSCDDTRNDQKRSTCSQQQRIHRCIL